jgi:hypothetical protein
MSAGTEASLAIDNNSKYSGKLACAQRDDSSGVKT